MSDECESKDRPPLCVSVVMITFNHERFVAQAIEGVLSQKATFSFELVIGEDASTDGTRRICLEYERKYPEIVRVIRRENNLGMQRNFMETIQASKGKYVALCEGDDYWTDELKLQKQIDFLENNPEFAVCHHRLKIITEGLPDEARISNTSPEVTTFENLAARQHIMTASCVFRNKLFEFPPMFLEVYGTDYVLNLLNSYHGKIKFINETMGVYRIQDQGEWSGRNLIDRAEKARDTIRKCREYFYPRASKEFDFHARKADCLLQFEKKEFHSFRSGCGYLMREHRRLLDLRDWSTLSAKYLLSFSEKLIHLYASASKRLKVM